MITAANITAQGKTLVMDEALANKIIGLADHLNKWLKEQEGK